MAASIRANQGLHALESNKLRGCGIPDARPLSRMITSITNIPSITIRGCGIPDARPVE
ncbi:MAG: hypothetical protein M3Z24_00320 [Chloroflexota bacterium]|nr:hypothetical protein [Chloroflexota bacterium]